MQYQATSHYYNNYNYNNYSNYLPHYPILTVVDPLEKVAKLASQSAVVIFSLSTCCMCMLSKACFVAWVLIQLFMSLMMTQLLKKALVRLMGNSSTSTMPVVFIGGKLVGSMDRVMASHINGTLVPLLKEAGALWL